MNKVITIILVLGLAFIGYKAYEYTYSEDVEFEMTNLKIIKANNKGDSQADAQGDAQTDSQSNSAEEIHYNVKIADTVAERSMGLMFVEEMAEDSGMIFIFPTSRTREMWMKNTYVSLDMLFITPEKEIKHIVESATPNSTKRISSVVPVPYVLELKAGQVKKHGIKVGDRIEFEYKK